MAVGICLSLLSRTVLTSSLVTTKANHMSESFDFFQLHEELFWIELNAGLESKGESQKPISRDVELPIETLDWTPWIRPDREKVIGGGGFGDAFLGKWKNVHQSLGEMPRVVVKVMKVDLLPERQRRKRFKVWYE